MKAFLKRPALYRSPFLALCALPLFIFVLWTFGPSDTDQFHLYGNIQVSQKPGLLGGTPGVEPNEGWTSYALGYRATRDLLSGHLPLWNPYEGLGTPLLGEMQSAALFPFTWLIPLPSGQVLERVLLQFLGGLGAYLFFRQYGLGGVAALSGAMAWEVNGTFAWMRNAVFNPVALLPWLFLAIEMMHGNARQESVAQRRSTGIALGAAAAALAVYAGFPEEVYLYSLLLVSWVLFRLFELTPNQIRAFVADLSLAAALGIALSAPALVTFVDFLREGFIGIHAGDFHREIYPHYVFLLIYIMPYIFGPVAAYPSMFFGGFGGYLGLSPLLLGLAALGFTERRATKIFLVIWVILAVGISIGLPTLYRAFAVLPLAKATEPWRYLNTSWTFSAIFLAALFIDDVVAAGAKRTWRRLIRLSVLLVSAGLLVLTVVNRSIFHEFVNAGFGNKYVLWATAAAVFLLFAVMAVISIRTHGERSASIFGGVLVVEALAWFLVPYLSYPRSTVLDYGPVRFLQKNIGLQRVALANDIGLAPNYGSVFGIPMLNYTDLPVPARTISYIKRNLDPYPTDIFLTRNSETERRKLFVARLQAYARAGVKYVVANGSFNDDLIAEGQASLPVAYSGRASTVYQLPSVRPYFSADGCDITPLSRTRVQVSCDRPSRLVRLEVYMSGWQARLNGAPVAIGTEDDTFQAVDMPQGTSVITFKYWPPGFTAALIAASTGLAVLIAISLIARWQRGPRRSATTL